MSNLEKINNTLHEDSLCNKTTILEEGSVNMKIPIDSTGCKFLLYKYDKQLKKEYKGGLFPFFAKKKSVCSVSDYILFTETKGKLFILIIELKKGKDQTLPQLKASKCFVDYVINTINRIYNVSIIPQIRLISVHEYKLPKKKVKDRGVMYDKEFHCQLKDKKFEIRKFLI